MKLRELMRKSLVVLMAVAMVATSAPGSVFAMDYEDQPLGANVALNKTVIVPGNNENAARIVDGNTGNGWQAPLKSPDETDKRFDPQEWIIDLEDSFMIDKVKLYWEAACAKTFNIYVAETNDETTEWTKVAEEENGKDGDHIYSFEATKARYVKLDLQYRAMDYGYNLYECYNKSTISNDAELVRKK